MCSTHGREIHIYGKKKSEGKRSLGRPRSRLEDVDWIHLAQDRVFCEHDSESLDSMYGVY
jgi:hypothetical protein